MKDKMYRQWLTGRRSNGGFSLVAVLIGGVVVSALAVGGTALYNNYQQDLAAQGRGKQIGAALDALEAFSRKHQTSINSGASIAGVANAMAPSTAELRALGYAAGSFDDASQPGGALLFTISREPVGCAPAKCVLALTAVTSGSVQVAGKVDESFARLIAGYVPNGAGWSNAPNDPANLTKKGIALPNPRGSTPAVVAAKLWLGNGQASQTVPPPYNEYRDAGCPAGYSGYKRQRRTITTDKWGNTTTSSWTTIANYCEPPPPEPEPEPTPTPSPGGGGGTTPPTSGGGGGTTPPNSGGSSPQDPPAGGNPPDDEAPSTGPAPTIPTPPVVTCPAAYYSCTIPKPNRTLLYANYFDPPTCKKRTVLIGEVQPEDASCGNEI